METLTVGGIDPSSKRIVLVESRKGNRKKAFTHQVWLRAERIEDRQLEAFDFLVHWAMGVRERDGQSPRIYMEAPIMGVGGPGATIPQAFVEGSLMAAAAQTECYIALVNNQTWKKKSLGKGNIPKAQVTELMRGVWPEFVDKVPLATAGDFKGKPDQDIVDAGAINLFGWETTLLIERLTKLRKKGS